MKIRRDTQAAKQTAEQIDDLGIGTKITNATRVINKNGTFNVVRVGMDFWTPYQSLVEMSLGRFLLLILFAYVAINIFFGGLYLLVGLDSFSGMASSGSFLQDLANATFFSIQTFTTVGYGSMSPVGFAANIVASLDALVGLMALALATGLIFARFAKPKAQILFSKKALIAPFQNGMSFQFRIANKRPNKIIDLEALAVMTWVEMIQGKEQRKYANLPLDRNKVSLFPLNWTIVHPIDEVSPFYQKTAEDLISMNAEVLIMIKGFDETYSQMVHINSSYLTAEVIWNAKFKLMYHDEPGRGTILHLDQIDDYELLGTPGTRSAEIGVQASRKEG